ncbi:MAG: hypothetical protein KME11_12450 [Timaviella obliquedivisa GSE-PSE-MK23-08B]|jgi:transposase-like protein|nr:hypothetical protein [Timaviella obliquedivisa GSE-PSE-MK23-08B]
MAHKLDEVTLAKVKKSYVNNEGTLSQLAQRFGIGERTLKRYSSQQNWEGLRLARGTVVSASVRDRVSAAPAEFDPAELLRTAILDLAASLPECQVKSKESGAAAMSRLIESWHRLNPLSMSELADLAIATPGFSPKQFAAILRQRLEQDTAG